MKILFITGLYPKATEEYYYINSGKLLQSASNVFQWAIVKGMYENNVDFSVLSYPFLPCFLNGYTKTSTIPETIVYEKKIIGKSPKYCSLPFLKEITIKKSIKKEIFRWVEQSKINKDENFVILIYSAYGPFLAAAGSLKSIFPNMCICPIITDMFLSSIDDLKGFNIIKKIHSYIELRSIQKNLHSMNKYVMLAHQMCKFIPEASTNHLILEGIALDDCDKMPIRDFNDSKKILLYTGSLGIHTSVEYLVKAFHELTESHFSLIICGDGYYRSLVEEFAAKDSRIIYKGNVPRDQAVKLQQEATAVINPRRSDIRDTPYSFPSKTIEYLLSGTPMIGYKLEGIPNEYYEYFYPIPDLSIESLKETIRSVLLMDSELLQIKAQEAYKFIKLNKTAKQQINRLMLYLNK